jgi:hypothetical protein
MDICRWAPFVLPSLAAVPPAPCAAGYDPEDPDDPFVPGRGPAY